MGLAERPHVDPDPSCVAAAVQAEFTKLLPGQSPAGFRRHLKLPFSLTQSAFGGISRYNSTRVISMVPSIGDKRTSDMMSAGEAMGSSAKKMVAVSSSASVVAKALATGAKLVDCSHTITPKTLTFAQVFDLLPGQDGQKTQGFKQV